jgi:3,4-dihydroxy 2-butanone 4-phosphate synthase/GTP cyclohydrolase II
MATHCAVIPLPTGPVEQHPGPAVLLDTIARAVADIKAGKAVVVIDDEDRENEGDLIFAAELATPELVAFMVRYTSGYICVPLTEDRGRPAGPAADVPPVNQDRAAPRTPSPSTPAKA